MCSLTCSLQGPRLSSRALPPPVTAFHPVPGEAPKQLPKLRCRNFRGLGLEEALLGHSGSESWPPSTRALSWRSAPARRGVGGEL